MRAPVSLVVIAVVIAVLTSGCLGGTAEVAPASLPGAGDDAAAALNGFPDPLIVAHDHGDAALHADLTTATMAMLGSADFSGTGVGPVVASELDLLGDDHLLVAGFAQGFHVVDISDRTAPHGVSFTPTPGTAVDIKANADGSLAFVATQLAGAFGLSVYDVSIPARPLPLTLMFNAPGQGLTNGGCHMLDVFEGYLYCAPTDATVRIYEIVRVGNAVALLPTGMYAPLGAPATPFTSADAGESFTHDMTLQADPLTGGAVMVVSFWDYGVRVVDVCDPTAPEELGAWAGEGAPEWFDGNLHTSMMTAVEGRRVVVTVPEYSATPSVWFINMTDYDAPTLLSHWSVKARTEDYGQDSRTFSLHNFQLVGGKVYLAMYHGGVWVLDATSLDAIAAPRTLGYHATPTARAAGVGASGLGGSLSVWDVVLKDGVIYASDMAAGVIALTFEGDTVGDATLTSWA